MDKDYGLPWDDVQSHAIRFQAFEPWSRLIPIIIQDRGQLLLILEMGERKAVHPSFGLLELLSFLLQNALAFRLQVSQNLVD
jgi:hypothetical protein